MAANLIYHLPLQEDLQPVLGSVGASFSRAGSAWYPNDEGVYTLHGNNVPGFNSKGLFNEPNRVNRCTNFNANPDEELTGVSVDSGQITRVKREADLKQAGLENICDSGYVFRYENTGAATATITISGEIGSTDRPAAISLWAKVSGNGTVTYRLGDSFGAQYIVPGKPFQRYFSGHILGHASTDTFQISVPSGTSIEWVLNQLEDASFGTLCGPTTPIVTQGDVGQRYATLINLPASMIPSDQEAFVLAMDMYLPTASQDSEAPYWFHIQKDGDNYLRAYGSEGRNRQEGENYDSRGKWASQAGLSKIAVLVSEPYGVGYYVNGSKPISVSLSPMPDLSTATINLLRKNDGSQYAAGQVSNIKVYAGEIEPEEVRSLTEIEANFKEDLGDFGIPCYDTVIPNRIWALKRTGDSFRELHFSDNWGDTWNLHVSLSSGTTTGFLVQDSKGNLYYGNSSSLFRIKNGTTNVETVLSWTPNAEGNWSFLNWAWGETSDGNLFVGAYHMEQTGYQRLWKSTDGGDTWTRIDVFADEYPNERHIHSMRVDRSNDYIYVSIGDAGTRGTFVSKDQFATSPTRLTPDSSPGPTCITISDESVYISTDVAGTTNYLQEVSDDYTQLKNIWTVPVPFQLAPLYFAAVAGNDEIWLVSRNDNSVPTQFASIFKLTKSSGKGNKWQLVETIAIDDRTQNEMEYYGLAHDSLNGAIPEYSPYVYIGYKHNTSTASPQGLYRIKRPVTSPSPRPGPVYLKDYDTPHFVLAGIKELRN